MLYWKANFNIPNSHIQAAEVFTFLEKTPDSVKVSFYADREGSLHLFDKDYTGMDINNENDLLELEDFINYNKV